MAVNIQLINQGFGSYLKNILPDDVATAAGAFSAAMLQVRNVETVPIEKLAQVISNIESTKGLPLVAGSDVPVNTALADKGMSLIALGTGPNGSYTMSDLLGSMSALPYPWASIEGGIKDLQTNKLFNIYNQLFLAVTWEAAVISITMTKYNVLIQSYIAPDPGIGYPGQPRIDDWYYTIDFSIADSGGGYYRGNAVAPLVSFSPNNCGCSATVNIGTNDADAASNGSGSFGRVTSFATKNVGVPYKYGTTSVMQANAPSAPTAPTESVTIQTPPTATLAVLESGAIDTSGVNTSPGKTTNTDGGSSLSPTGWSGMNAVVQQYIDQANTEILVIRQNNPIGAVQLNNWYDQTGTQLTIEQQTRKLAFSPVPVPQNDTLSQYPMTLYSFVDTIPTFAVNTLPHMYAQTLEAISDIDIIGGQSIVAMMRENRNKARLALAGIQLDNNIDGRLTPVQTKTLIANGRLITPAPGTTLPSMYPKPTPLGYYDPDTNAYIVTFDPNINEYTPNSNDPVYIFDPNTNGYVSRQGVLDTGAVQEPGSLAGSPYQNLVPPELNTAYTSDILPSSVYSVPEAIDEVVKCNCDCWVQ